MGQYRRRSLSCAFRQSGHASVEGTARAFAQRAQNHKTLNCGVSCLHGFDTPHRLDQLLELALISLNDVFQVCRLAVLKVGWALGFLVRFANGLIVTPAYVPLRKATCIGGSTTCGDITRVPIDTLRL